MLTELLIFLAFVVIAFVGVVILCNTIIKGHDNIKLTIPLSVIFFIGVLNYLVFKFLTL